MAIVTGTSTDTTTPAVRGTNTSAPGPGVVGSSVAVEGESDSGWGVYGHSKTGRGVVAGSESDYGLRAFSTKSAGLRASSVEGRGVEGWATKGEGVVGISSAGNGVWGQTDGAGTGVLGTSKSGIGVHGIGGQLAGLFEGNVQVTGDLSCPNADCAEEFDVIGPVDPGTVMVLGHEGAVSESQHAYDRRVAGVISGGGHYRPAIVLDRSPVKGTRQPVALMGKVFCKVDAQFGSIEIGDLLTTSPTPGHAMRTTEPDKAFGAVIGKALRPQRDGRGLIPILIALQ